MAADDEVARLEVGVRHMEADGRWYVVVAIWDNDAATGPPVGERVGPIGGLATEAEALIFYHEKVRPITDAIVDEHEAEGGTCEHMIKEVLH